ncbi:phage virion morphogenesis (putative tail completion) protein [Enterobacter sp. kpr-6]|nr:phage virion morphogenesis (putative tail completion) protein [Enterobacter sp. kpr-6]
MGDLQRVDDWLAALLANLEPAARSRMMRQLAQELRRSQQQNIRLQRNPDGSGYEPRRVTEKYYLLAQQSGHCVKHCTMPGTCSTD